MGLWCWAWTHGVLGGRYAKRCRTAQGRGEAGQHGEDGDSGAGAGGHVGDGHEALALGELDDQLILLAPAAEAMRVSVSAGRSGRERCVPAAQSRRMPERALGLLLTSGGWWVWASAPIRQHMRPRAATRLKPVADEAGRGYTCGTSRGAVATYACSRAPAQPAPRSTCTASPYTPRPASRGSAERRRGRWLREGRCRGVGWGRWDGLIGYDTPTAGRLRAAPISGSGCGS